MSELKFSVDPLDILKAKLEDHELKEPEIITAPKIFYEDVSSEAFAYHIALGHPSVSLWSDEGGLFGPWYLYGVGFFNPDSDSEDLVKDKEERLEIVN